MRGLDLGLDQQAQVREVAMPWKPKVSVKLIKCKRCRKMYNNPLTHVCVVRMDYGRRTGKGKRR